MLRFLVFERKENRKDFIESPFFFVCVSTDSESSRFGFDPSLSDLSGSMKKRNECEETRLLKRKKKMKKEIRYRVAGCRVCMCVTGFFLSLSFLP